LGRPPEVTILPQEPGQVHVRLEPPALRAVRDDHDAFDVQPSQDRPDGWRVATRQRTNVGQPGAPERRPVGVELGSLDQLDLQALSLGFLRLDRGHDRLRLLAARDGLDEPGDFSLDAGQFLLGVLPYLDRLRRVSPPLSGALGDQEPVHLFVVGQDFVQPRAYRVVERLLQDAAPVLAGALFAAG